MAPRACIIMARRVVTTLACCTTGSATAAMTRASSSAFDLIELDGDDLRREPLDAARQPSHRYCAAGPACG
jgi:uncharacterized protein YccT (UPF0319 family)